MTAGDAVGGISAATLTFQPAAGVEVMIFWAAGSTYQAEFYNGANANIISAALTGYPCGVGGVVVNDSYGTGPIISSVAPKLLITNTNYLRINKIGAPASNCGYSGIQTK